MQHWILIIGNQIRHCWCRDSRGNNLECSYINGSSGSNLHRKTNKLGGKDNRIFVILLVELAEDKHCVDQLLRFRKTSRSSWKQMNPADFCDFRVAIVRALSDLGSDSST